MRIRGAGSDHVRTPYLKFAPEDAIHKTHEKLALGFDQRKLTGVSLSSLSRMSGLQPCNTGRMSRWGMSAPKLVMAENASQLDDTKSYIHLLRDMT